MQQKIFLAAGCFWGVEEAYQHLDGVLSTTVGYTGGTTTHPTYDEVCTGRTGHAETVEIIFDPDKVSLKKILRAFWTIHDPTQKDRQGNDIGTQYRSAIFTTTPEQAEEANKQISILKREGKNITTEVKPINTFFKAEEYHQRYLQKNPNGYCHIPRRTMKNINQA